MSSPPFGLARNGIASMACLTLANPPLFIAILVTIVLLLTEIVELIEEEERVTVSTAIAQSILDNRRRKRALRRHDNHTTPDSNKPRKRIRKEYDRDRALQCIQSDYLSPTATFVDDFKRIFRITRGAYDVVRNFLLRDDYFFRESFDCCGVKSISPDAKILIALKYLAYGVSVNAFRDYFQLGESTALLCCERFVRALVQIPELREKYLRTLTRTDAKRVEALHARKHGIRGMVGSLDCMHIPWKNCPLALHGQYVGKDKKPTVVLEAACDYNLWIWHMQFGFAGSLNDLNIWANSVLKSSFTTGKFCENDFIYEIAGQSFALLFYLVDGIYPELARFVKTIFEPIGRAEKRFSVWQEAKRKDIERCFGVLQAKFQIIKHPVQKWDLDDIADIVLACTLLHNIMVEFRIEQGEEEAEHFYDISPDVAVVTEQPPMDHALISVLREEQRIAGANQRLQELRDGGKPMFHRETKEAVDRIAFLPQRMRVVQRRWEQLYSKEENRRLRQAIVKALTARKNAMDAKHSN